jgi:hypothetical protein
VRVLRVLAEFAHPMPAAELARATHLDLSGVGRTIERLAELGVVSLLGVGRGRVAALSATHSLTPVLRSLFLAERERRQLLLTALQDAVARLAPAPRAAWIEGPHASGQDTAHDALRLGVLAGVRERQLIAEQLAPLQRDIEQRFDLTVELVVRTRADLETLSPAQRELLTHATLLYGVLPIADRPTRTHGLARSHADVDQQSRAAGERLARAVVRDPRLIARAQRWIDRRMPHASEGERHALREWSEILAWPPHRLGAFLRDGGERATRLRQTSPFVGAEVDVGRGGSP